MAERRGSGTPIFVLIHGIGLGRSVFADLIDHLDDTAQVIAIDLPGYGEAPEPPHVLTIERTADLIAAYLRERVDESVVLVGHSMGAQIAIEIAARHPDTASHIVLIGPSGDRRGRSATAQLGRLVRDIAIESPRVIAVGAREYVRAGPNLRLKFRAMLVHEPERVIAQVTAPTLVLRGENDIVSPAGWCRFLVSELPNGTLKEIPGHGHESMIRDAAPAAALIGQFLVES